MASTPQAMPTSTAPAATSPATMWLACWEEPHWQSTVVAAVSNGRPAPSQAFRVTFEACSPAWVTQPPTTCSTSAGSTPARLMTSTWAAARTSAACMPDSTPFRLPIGVRAASTITGWPIWCSPHSLARLVGATLLESVLVCGPGAGPTGDKW